MIEQSMGRKKRKKNVKFKSNGSFIHASSFSVKTMSNTCLDNILITIHMIQRIKHSTLFDLCFAWCQKRIKTKDALVSKSYRFVVVR